MLACSTGDGWTGLSWGEDRGFPWLFIEDVELQCHQNSMGAWKAMWLRMESSPNLVCLPMRWLDAVFTKAEDPERLLWSGIHPQGIRMRLGWGKEMYMIIDEINLNFKWGWNPPFLSDVVNGGFCLHLQCINVQVLTEASKWDICKTESTGSQL